MLLEVKRVRQIENEPRRRWFADDYFDLIVWLDQQRRIIGFQLCYGKPANERAMTWKRDSGYTHQRIDNGEQDRSYAKATPILVPDGEFEPIRIGEHFRERSRTINKRLARFVYNKIRQYG